MTRRPLLALALVLAILPTTGCFGSKLAKARGSAAPLLPLPMTKADEPPPPIMPPPAPETPGTLTKTGATDAPLRRLALRAVESEKLLGNYLCRIRRREALDGKMQPEEVMLLKFRRGPLSVHVKWLGDQARGREIAYVQGRHEDKIHFLTGKGDLFGAGRRMSFPADSTLVRSKSHYPITEAGLGAATVRFGQLMAAIERGQSNAGTARYLGLVARPEFGKPVEGVEQAIPAGLESFLPRGGVRQYFFDDVHGLPTVVQTWDEARNEVEFYHFDRLQMPANLDDRDFDPAELWRR